MKNAFFEGFLLKHHFLRACHFGSDWIVFIKSEIIIVTGISWPVSYDKWKVPIEETGDTHVSSVNFETPSFMY